MNLASPRRPTARTMLLLTALLAPAGALAAGGSPEPPAEPRAASDLAAGQKAIAAQDWAGAVRHLTRAASREPKNPDVHNLLGFAERKQGHLDAAFAHYGTALKLDPKHRAAREYLGEAYLQAGKLPEAQEQLGALEKICGTSCEEYRDLAEAIAAHRKKG